MLYEIPPILPVSDLRSQAKEILNRVSDKPVVITQNGRPSAVMLSYRAYNEMVDQLTSYQKSERESYSQLSEVALKRVWENDQDAAYDNWRDLYGISAR